MQGVAILFPWRAVFILISTARVVFCCAGIFFATTAWGETNSFAARAERAYTDAQQQVRKAPTNNLIAIQFARAAFEWAEFAHRDEARADIAQHGIDLARTVLIREPTNAAAHYWLAMNLGQLARTKSLGALKLVREMESAFTRAANLDPHTDYAGPDRSLGYLYRDTPGWPASIGSKKKAREHFERAVQLHPEFPDNQLALLESFEQWADRMSFESQFKVTEHVLSEGKRKFTGPEWDSSWADWNKRFDEMKTKAGAVGKSPPSKGAK